MIQEYLDIGKIVNTHGVKGELKILPFTDDITRFERLNSVLIKKSENDYDEYVIDNVRYHKDFVLIKFDKVDNMNDAEKLKNRILSIKRQDAIDLPEDTYFICELIGCKVYENDRLLGELIDVIQTGSNDVYVVKREGHKDLLIPVLKDVVKVVDIENERIEVELLEGLE